MTPVAHEIPAMAALQRCRQAWERHDHQTHLDLYPDAALGGGADTPPPLDPSSERATHTGYRRSSLTASALIPSAEQDDANTPLQGRGSTRALDSTTSEET